jgi:hypothetical protein
MPAVAPPPAAPAPIAAAPAVKVTGNDQLSWDDDELETQIYDNPEEEAAAKARKAGLMAPAAGAPPSMGNAAAAASGAGAGPGPGPGGGDGPDLSSLVSTAKGWDAPGSAQPPKAGPNAPTLLSAGTGPLPPPGQLAAGSAKSPSPFSGPSGAGAFAAPFGAEAATPNLGGRRESSAIERLVSAAPAAPAVPGADDGPFNPMASFGSSVVAKGKKSNAALFAAIGGAVVLLGGGFLVYKLASGSSSAAPDKGKPDVVAKGPASGATPAAGSAGATTGSGGAVTPPVAPGSGSASAAATGPGLSAQDLASTGFDLYVTPNNVSGWRIDNQINTSRLPAQIRSVQPGRHTIAIDAPPGFMSATQVVDVEAGKAGKVEITLQPIDITGVFETTPAGARVYLVVNGQRIAVGQTPAKYKLDPRMTYQVILEKDGYVSVSRPLAISGNPEEKVDVTLEKAQIARAGGGTHNGGSLPGGDHGGATDHGTPPGGTDHGGTPPGGGATDHGGTPPGGSDKGGGDKGGGDKGGTPPGGADKGGATDAGGEGILSIGSKPPCDIYIDGKATGLKTPQREIKLPAGHHKVTLMNNDFSIKESFGVDIKAGQPTKTVKDYSDRIPQ